MGARQSTATERPTLCYCPGAVRELIAARDELVKARTQLQAHDPNWNAINELREAREELQRARDLLRRVTQVPAQETQAAELLARLAAAMPKVDYIADIYRQIREARLIH